MMNASEVRVIVLGKNYSTALGVIRALGFGGHSIELFYISTRSPRLAEIAGASRYVNSFVIQKGRRDEEIIGKVLERYGKLEGVRVLLPTDDYSCSLIDRFRDRLAPLFVMPYVRGGGNGAIMELMDKSAQLELARKHGLNAAKTWTISLREPPRIPGDVCFPCIVKPQISARGYKSEIGVCRDRDALEAKLGQLRRRLSERSVLVQELLGIDEEFSISGVCLEGDVRLPALLRKIRIAEFEKGVTLMGQVCGFDALGVDAEAGEGFLRALKALIGELGYCGLIDIEVIRSGGRLYFNEINFRNSGVGYAVTRAGVNLPLMLLEFLLGQPAAEPAGEVRYGLKFLYDKAAWEEYIFGGLSRKQLRRYRDEADFTMLECADDPEPEKLFHSVMRGILAKERLKRVLPVRQARRALKGLLGRRGKEG